MAATPQDGGPPVDSTFPRPHLLSRVWRSLVGPPRDLGDRSLFHRLALFPFLAWVGLGADGLSSSSYGPEEAFRTLGGHAYLALPLAAVMAVTIFIISAAYARIIEEFPHGGGGYVVASKLLGERAGVVSGSALIVDYVLTITVSIAAAGEALFSFLPPAFEAMKLPIEVVLIATLILLNIRGVRESVVAMVPIFLVFLGTHAIIIVGGIAMGLSGYERAAEPLAHDFDRGSSTLGWLGMAFLLARAYSLGGGTYTGIEAVSNGMAVMQEPKVATAKRTMLYMAVSLAVTASGLLVCYLLWGVTPVEGRTMNATLVERIVGVDFAGRAFAVLTLFSEAALLVVAAQAGFMDGPRVLANMAVDGWIPRHFSSLSDRLTTQNGILLMGGTALVALLYTGGDVRELVVMYSINVFVTFALSMLAMTIHCWRTRAKRPSWERRLALFVTGFALCTTILGVTLVEKFGEGGWLTVLVTGIVVGSCFVVRRHYRRVGKRLGMLYAELAKAVVEPATAPAALDPAQPTAAILVAAYGGLGIHTLYQALKTGAGQYKNVVFLSVGVVDSGIFKGEDGFEDLRVQTEGALGKYIALAQGLGLAATSRSFVGTDAAAEAEQLCVEVLKEFPQTTFFAGKVVFEEEAWYHRLLHNETAFGIQRRLQQAGKQVVIVSARLD